MKILVKEKLSPHKYKDNSGYLICVDSILARTGQQEYIESEIFPETGSNEVISVNRKENQVFSDATMTSFENKPITCEHPDENVSPENHRELSVGLVRNIKRGKINGQDVMLGTLVITDAQIIEDIENGVRTDLSCGYDCDIVKDDQGNYEQINIRGNHVALCEQGRAGIAKIVDSVNRSNTYVIYAHGTENGYNALYRKKHGQAKYSTEAEADVFTKEQAQKLCDQTGGKYSWVMRWVDAPEKEPQGGRYPKVTSVTYKKDGNDVTYTIGDRVKVEGDALNTWEIMKLEKPKDVNRETRINHKTYINNGRNGKALIHCITDNSRNDYYAEFNSLTPIKVDSEPNYTIENVKGHYEIYKDGKFIQSEDTKSEAEAAIEELKLTKGLDSNPIRYMIYLDTDDKYKGTPYENFKAKHKNMDEITNLSVIEGLNSTGDMVDYVAETLGYNPNEIAVKNRTYDIFNNEEKSIQDNDIMVNNKGLYSIGSYVKTTTANMKTLEGVYKVIEISEKGNGAIITVLPLLGKETKTFPYKELIPLTDTEVEMVKQLIEKFKEVKFGDDYSKTFYEKKLKMLKKRLKDLERKDDSKEDEILTSAKNSLIQTVKNQIDECCEKLGCDKNKIIKDSMTNNEVYNKIKSLYKEALSIFGKEGYASWKKIEEYLFVADDPDEVAQTIQRDINNKKGDK